MPAPVKSVLRFVASPRLYNELLLLIRSDAFTETERSALHARFFDYVSIREAARRTGLSHPHVQRLEQRVIRHFETHPASRVVR